MFVKAIEGKGTKYVRGEGAENETRSRRVTKKDASGYQLKSVKNYLGNRQILISYHVMWKSTVFLHHPQVPYLSARAPR